MTELQKMCVAEVPSSLKPDNAISWMQLGNQLDIADFKAQCEEIIAGHLAEISSHRDFLAMTHAEVKDCLSGVSNSESAHEDDDVLQAAMHWVCQDTEDRVTHLESLLKEIQLDNCSQKAIFNVLKTHRRTVVANINAYDLLTDALQQITTKEAPKLSSESKVKVKEMLVVIGGQVKEQVSPVCWYLDSANKIVELCKIPFEDLKCRHSICETPEGFVITGGQDSKLCMSYNVETKAWSKLQKLRAKRYGHGSICISRVLFVFGGQIAGLESKSVDCLALDDGKWQKGPELLVSVYWPRVTQINGTIFLFDSFRTKQLLELDSETNTWVRRASPPPGVDDAVSMSCLNGQLFLAGGRQGHGCVSLWYNPVTNSWSKGQQPLQNHCYGSLVLHDSNVILLGGKTDEVEELCIKTGAWSVSNIKLPSALFFHQALVLNIPQYE